MLQVLGFGGVDCPHGPSASITAATHNPHPHAQVVSGPPAGLGPGARRVGEEVHVALVRLLVDEAFQVRMCACSTCNTSDVHLPPATCEAGGVGGSFHERMRMRCRGGGHGQWQPICVPLCGRG